MQNTPPERNLLLADSGKEGEAFGGRGKRPSSGVFKLKREGGGGIRMQTQCPWK